MSRTRATILFIIVIACCGCERRSKHYEYAVFDTVGGTVSLPDGLVSADRPADQSSEDVGRKEWHTLTKKLGGTGEEPDSPVAAVLNLLGREGWKVVGYTDGTTGGGKESAIFRYHTVVLMRTVE